MHTLYIPRAKGGTSTQIHHRYIPVCTLHAHIRRYSEAGSIISRPWVIVFIIIIVVMIVLHQCMSRSLYYKKLGASRDRCIIKSNWLLQDIRHYFKVQGHALYATTYERCTLMDNWMTADIFLRDLYLALSGSPFLLLCRDFC